MKLSVKPIQGGGRYDATLDQAVLAERLGFDGVYISQHHGFPDAGYWPSPLVALAGLATRTDTITLGTALVQLPLENPVALAGKITTLDVMSDGRADVGLGLGWREAEFDALGVPKPERGRRMTEYLDLVDRLLRPGPTTFDGEFFALTDFELDPAPVQSPRPSLFVGGKSDAAFERATTTADGWNPPAGVPVSRLGTFADRFRKVSDGRFIVGTEGTVVREDRSDARDAGKRLLVSQKRPIFEAPDSPYADEYDDFQTFESSLRGEFDEYLEDSTFLAGTPDDCIDVLTTIEETTDCDEVIFRVSAPTVSADGTTETVERLGRDVLPSF